jgi:hypothetical protein
MRVLFALLAFRKVTAHMSWCAKTLYIPAPAGDEPSERRGGAEVVGGRRVLGLSVAAGFTPC